MAKGESPENVGERAMFAPGAAPFDLPVPRSDLPTVLPRRPLPASGKPEGSLKPTVRERLHSQSIAIWRARHSMPTRPAAWRAVERAMALELDRGIAFLLVPVFLSCGALIYFLLGHEPGFATLLGSSAVLALCAFLARTRPALHMVLVAVLLCVLGALLAKTETWRAGTKMLGGEITTQLSGRVVEAERLADGRVRLTIDVTGTARPVLRYAPERVRVSARKIPQGITAGSAVTGLVRLMSPTGPVRPGSYDFSFESYFDGIGASGFFLRGPELVAETGAPPWIATFRATVERARYAIAQRISSSIGGPEGEIAAALVVGVRAGIPEEVNEALRRAGIYHIISISGLHMALVAGTIMVILRSGFALFPDFSSRHPVKKYAAALALIGLAAYLFISGGDVAAQRSFIMFAVMLVAVLFDRAALTLRNLAISAVIVIIVSPHEVVGPSFQMSFAATAALVGAYAAWSDWRMDKQRQSPTNFGIASRIWRYLLTATVGLAATSVVAGGATAIYAAWHFQQMPSLGLFTNLTAMPIVSAIVMPFAVLGTLLMPFGIDAPFFYVMGLGLSATIAIAQWFAERTTADIVGLVSPAAVAILTVALLLATITSTLLRVAAVPVMLAGLLFLFVDRPRPTLFASEDGRLIGLDMGGGQIAVNRSRPNEFTIDNWKRAVRAKEVVAPEGKQQRTKAVRADEEGGAGELSGNGRSTPDTSAVDQIGAAGTPDRQSRSQTRTEANDQPKPVASGPGAEPAAKPEVADNGSAKRRERAKTKGGFACSEGLCVAHHRSGAVVAHALDAAAATDACATATILIIEDASAKDVCRWKDVLVVTGRDLALYGSAAVTLPTRDGRSASRMLASITTEFAISRPYRPWHEQRRFSRAARGLPPYQPKPKQTAGNPPQAVPPEKQTEAQTAE